MGLQILTVPELEQEQVVMTDPRYAVRKVVRSLWRSVRTVRVLPSEGRGQVL